MDELDTGIKPPKSTSLDLLEQLRVAESSNEGATPAPHEVMFRELFSKKKDTYSRSDHLKPPVTRFTYLNRS